MDGSYQPGKTGKPGKTGRPTRRRLTAVTCFLLDLAPYLELLAEPDFAVDVPSNPSAAGTVNTWPG